MSRIGAIVLAAGASERMGGEDKLLEPLGTAALGLHAVYAAIGSIAEPVVVVVRDASGELAELLPPEVSVVVNPNADLGLSSSLQAGIRALPDSATGAVVLLADMPFVTEEHIDLLVRQWQPGRVCVPVYRSRRGNPVLWSSEYFGEILELEGDRGAKLLMSEHPEKVALVVMTDDGVCVDVDSPEDLERARSRPYP